MATAWGRWEPSRAELTPGEERVWRDGSVGEGEGEGEEAAGISLDCPQEPRVALSGSCGVCFVQTAECRPPPNPYPGV